MQTQNLAIPLLAGTDLVSRTKINEAFEAVDQKALGPNHTESKAHWALWQPGAAYSKGDLVRTDQLPSWGFLECTTAGTSDTVALVAPVAEGTSVNDGSVTWILRRLGSAVDLTDMEAGLSAANQKIQELQSGIGELNQRIPVPAGGTTGQVLVKKSTADGDVQWQDSAGVQGTFGGEFATKADLLAATDLQIGYNYIVTADESQGGRRSYYSYQPGKVWQYMGSFADGMATGSNSNVYSYQWNSAADVVANTEKSLSIPPNPQFNRLAPTVLKLEAGIVDQVQTVCEFDSEAAASFVYDSRYVEFVGSGTGVSSQMRLKTIYQEALSIKGTLDGTGQYSESDWVDPTKWKTVEKTEVI
ncbi:Hypothetical protein LUCI_0769 [Lucifera butyrica]|uniref:Uncharacterized protein n=1 Tax=Lucifera butyrica TaxID=1351585 RepID=A0A498R310_9FIRM|nr:hypothetical protein [Lucifera butyrica]VBB05559.1 Hypothetical protein LUCI_0769 [Lucifera butyrica]